MAEVTIYPTSNGSIAHSVVGGSTAYGCLADNSDDTYIRYVATKNEEVKTSTFNMGSSSSISGRYVVTGITVVSRTKKGYNSMDTASAHSNLYVGGIEGSSWGLDLSTSWTNRSHTSSVSEFSNLNGKALTSLPSLVLHFQSTTKVKTTGDNKWVGFSRAYITLTYDTLYSQSAQGSTGVSASLSNSGTAVEGYYKSGTTTTYTASLDDGYGFNGWYTAASGGTLVSSDLTYSETCVSDRTLYARAFKVSVVGDTGVNAYAVRQNDSTGRSFSFVAVLLEEKYGWFGFYDSASGGTLISGGIWDNESKSSTFKIAFSAGTADTTYYSRAFSVELTGSTGVQTSFRRYVGNPSGFVFNATLSDGYAFDGWYQGNVKKTNNISFTPHPEYYINENRVIELTAKAFSVEYYGDEGSSVSASRSENGLSYTFTGSFVDTSYSARTFNKWVVNNVDQSETSLELTVNISQNTVVTLHTFETSFGSSSTAGIASKTISRTDNTTVRMSCTLQNGWDFDGWYCEGVKVSSDLTFSVSPSSSLTYTPVATRHVYSVNTYGDAHCTTSVTADNYYLGSTVTVTATVTDSGYKFKGWYNDSSYTSLYSANATTDVEIDGDITLYAKTVLLDEFYIKENGAWVRVLKVYKKTNGSWVEVMEKDYASLFNAGTKYRKHENN